MGSSLDWSRASFTMDPKLCRAVQEAFVRMHQDGTIYRSTRLVNWSCTLKSAISDIEVDKHELTGRTTLAVPGYADKVEFGVIISFAYKVDGSDEEIVVATTRIETMLGDTGIAVHPNDERYKHLIGKFALHPYCGRKLLIVADDYVDINFGTGAVKITPAHDPNDYDIGQRHKLPMITIFSDEGVIIGDYGPFTGMKRFDARKAILKSLQELGLYRETKDNPMVVPVCSRSKDIVEPMIKPQWYVKCSEMAAKASEAVTSGQLKIVPEMHKKTWFGWMDNIRDWCISRQLWWGHRIPAYFVTLNVADAEVGDEADNRFWVSGRTEAEALANAAQRFNVSEDKITLKQDEDVLDTWFSSALFPFSVFGWPDQTEELDVFYPTTLLETGHDILFFWVARMVFFGQKLTGKLPFTDVYLHAMVRDAHGRKMSKSLGNVIDPLDVINGIGIEDLLKQLENSNLDPKEVAKAQQGQKEDYPTGIPECGTDALRFALCQYTAQGRDINLDVKRVQGYRFFCNKMWNATRFALNYLKDAAILTLNEVQLGVMDKWILSCLANAVSTCNAAFEEYDLPKATSAIYNFWLYELCDVYLEAVKPVFQTLSDESSATAARAVLAACFDAGLRLISPFMPFISEELWQRLPRPESVKQTLPPSINIARYPSAEEFGVWRNVVLEEEYKMVFRFIGSIRKVRASYNLPNRTKTQLILCCADNETMDVLERFSGTISTLSFCTPVSIAGSCDKTKGWAIETVSDKCDAYINLEGLVDVQKEIARITKDVEKKQQALGKLKEAMAVPSYSEKVSLDVQTKDNEKVVEMNAELLQLDAAFKTLSTME